MNFLHFLDAETYQIDKTQNPLICKKKTTATLEPLNSPKSIWRKILMTEKSWNFHTVECEQHFFTDPQLGPVFKVTRRGSD